MQKTINNVFFLDEPVSNTIQKMIEGKRFKCRVMKAGDSFIAVLKRESENSSILFRPESRNFTYEVNGHHYGTFFFEEEKIIAKWPLHLRDRDKKFIVREIQDIFRTYL
jgi:hypothetical protein